MTSCSYSRSRITEQGVKLGSVQDSKKGSKRKHDDATAVPATDKASGTANKELAANGLTVDQDRWLNTPHDKLTMTQLRSLTSGLFKVVRLAERKRVGDQSKQVSAISDRSCNRQ